MTWMVNGYKENRFTPIMHFAHTEDEIKGIKDALKAAGCYEIETIEINDEQKEEA